MRGIKYSEYISDKTGFDVEYRGYLIHWSPFYQWYWIKKPGKFPMRRRLTIDAAKRWIDSSILRSFNPDWDLESAIEIEQESESNVG